MTDTITLKQAVGIILEGFTLPDAARKILETAYFAEAALAQQAESALKYPSLLSCPWCSGTDRNVRPIRFGVSKCNHDWHTEQKVAQQAEQEPEGWDNCRAENQCRRWCGNSACVSHAAPKETK